LILLSSCGSLDNTEKKGFYNKFGTWDVLYIPIIPPYRASSTTKGETWLISDGNHGVVDIRLRQDFSGSIPTKSFGVSRNYIFGQTEQSYFRYCQSDVWFIFNINTGIYSDYDTKEEMFEVLKLYGVTETRISTCSEYYEILKKERKCYWFPETNKDYPKYNNDAPKTNIPISIVVDSSGGMDFTIPRRALIDKTKVYNFEIHINSNKNEIFYVSVNSTPPILAKTGVTFPVFIYEPDLTITVYTPFPVAKQKGIPEDKRIVLSKNLTLE